MDYYFISYGLIGIALLITTLAQVYVRSTYKKYSEVRNERSINGKEVARMLLDKNNLNNVNVTEVGGYLSDHYDPRSKTVRLSTSNYNDDSIAGVAVAAHECGHAIQDKVGYVFLRIRSSLIPLVNFSSFAGYIAIMIGIIFSIANLIWVGIILEMVILLFQLITLPVEFNASKRALKELNNIGLLNYNELKKSKKVLVAAALTYVASVTSTLLEILRLVLLFGRRRR